MTPGASGPDARGRPDPLPRALPTGPELILLDLDGTLVASGPGILASVRFALARLGHPIPPEPVLSGFIGPPLLDSFRDVCHLDPGEAWRAVTAYREFYAHTGQYDGSVYDGIPAALGALRSAGCTLAVATSKAEPYARSVLDHFGLSQWFPVIVGSELDGRRTAKQEVITEVLHRLGRGGRSAVMVGDRRQDALGARAVGIPCAGALWGYGSAAELREAGACPLVDTPADLPGALLSGTSP